MNTIELINYYADLLILQYVGKSKAYATIQTVVNPVVMPQVSVQTITFPLIPDTGSFVISWDGDETPAIDWDVTAAELQAILRGLAPYTFDGGSASAVSSDTLDGGTASSVSADIVDGGDAAGFGLGEITVTGSVADGFVITFTGIDPPPAPILTLVSSTLTSSGAAPVDPVITEIDETLPVAVQNAYNVVGDDIAQGVQLDVIGKYVGVSRTGQGFSTQITLDDADFTTLIQLAIIKNNSGSSLSTIVGLLYQFFGTQLVVYDYTNMFMSYSISTALGSTDLVQLVVTEGLLPKPMGVGEIIIIFSGTNAFGFEGSTHSGGFGDLTDASVGGEFASLFEP